MASLTFTSSPMARTTIDSLLGQLPRTDKQIEAAQPPPPPDAPKKKREPDWDPTAAGSKFTAPDAELAETLAKKALARGRASLLDLLARVLHVAGPSDDF